MYNLNDDLIYNIYKYDNTYHIKYSKCIIELKQSFFYHNFLNKLEGKSPNIQRCVFPNKTRTIRLT